MTVAPILCRCTGFVFWYADRHWHPGGHVVDIPVCTCGHADDEHLDGTKSCTGEVEVRR